MGIRGPGGRGRFGLPHRKPKAAAAGAIEAAPHHRPPDPLWVYTSLQAQFLMPPGTLPAGLEPTSGPGMR